MEEVKLDGRRNNKQPMVGRPKGMLNKRTRYSEQMMLAILNDTAEQEHWTFFLFHPDPWLRFAAFKLAKAYKSGMPKSGDKLIGQIAITNVHNHSARPGVKAIASEDVPQLEGEVVNAGEAQ